jgi:hypothetical protein
VNKNSSAWMGFLVIAFGVLGLVGAMGTYAAQIPFERALARNGALDQALAAAGQPDAAVKLGDLRVALDDSADHIMTAANVPLPDFPARVATERARMFAAFGADAHATGRQLRLVLAVFTATGAFFGAMVLGLVGRQGKE